VKGSGARFAFRQGRTDARRRMGGSGVSPRSDEECPGEPGRLNHPGLLTGAARGTLGGRLRVAHGPSASVSSPQPAVRLVAPLTLVAAWANPVTEGRIAVLGDVRIHPGPVPVVVPRSAAPSAYREQSRERLHLGQGVSKPLLLHGWLARGYLETSSPTASGSTAAASESRLLKKSPMRWSLDVTWAVSQ
jgi:hypothetical protein